MSSSKYSKTINISTFDFKINNTNLFSNKVLKDLRIFIARNLKWNHHINIKKILENRRLEFDLITFFKLVNGETTINIQ